MVPPNLIIDEEFVVLCFFSDLASLICPSLLSAGLKYISSFWRRSVRICSLRVARFTPSSSPLKPANVASELDCSLFWRALNFFSFYTLSSYCSSTVMVFSILSEITCSSFAAARATSGSSSSRIARSSIYFFLSSFILMKCSSLSRESRAIISSALSRKKPFALRFIICLSLSYSIFSSYSGEVPTILTTLKMFATFLLSNPMRFCIDWDFAIVMARFPAGAADFCGVFGRGFSNRTSLTGESFRFKTPGSLSSSSLGFLSSVCVLLLRTQPSESQ